MSPIWIALLACTSMSRAEDGAGVPTPAQIRAIYEEQTADADVVPKAVQEAFVAAEDRMFFAETMTLMIEQTLEREEILAWYLHGIYLGRGCYGVAAASQAYFGKTPEALTLAQAAMLAALPVAPTLYDPDRDSEKALTRRNFVLGQMNKAEFVTDVSAQAAATDPLGVIEPAQRCAD